MNCGERSNSRPEAICPSACAGRNAGSRMATSIWRIHDRAQNHSWAPLPPEVRGHFGPRLTAALAYMTVLCHIPRRGMQCLLEQVLGIPLSLGTTQNAWEEASAAVAEPYQELQEALPQQPVLNSDETSSRTKADKRWLWVFVAQSFVFYTIEISRGTEVLVRLLGNKLVGILGNDRLNYLKYVRLNAQVLMQLCWAHFKRNLLGAQEVARSRGGKRFCREASEGPGVGKPPP
jgi:Transposase IS66 family